MRIVLLILMVLLYGCSEENNSSQEILDYIPEDAAVIVQIENPQLFFNHLENFPLFQENKSYPLFKNLKEELSFLNHFPHKTPSYLSFFPAEDKKISFSFLTRGIPIINTDSVQNKMVETIKTGEHEIKRYSLGGKITFSAAIDSIFFISNSKQILEKSLNRKNKSFSVNEDFKAVQKAASKEKPTVFINHREFDEFFKILFPDADQKFIKNFSNWTALDLEINPAAIKFNGVTTATDTLSNFINIFRNVAPVQNKLALITPENGRGFYSFTFQDFETLAQNLNSFYNTQSEQKFSAERKLLENAVEAGFIYASKRAVFAIRSIDTEASIAEFAADNKVIEEFRGIKIYEYEDKAGFAEILQPLAKPKNLNYFIFLDEFILFSEDITALTNIVEHVQNKKTLVTNQAYLATLQDLSTEASILLVANTTEFKEVLANTVAAELEKVTPKLTFDNFPIAALQFIYSSDYAHVHGILNKTSNTKNGSGVKETASIKLDAELATAPVFFENHRNNGLDIAVQDVQNQLYLISNSGKVFWQKKLDYRILGKIHQVDLFRNGRIQLAFATPHAVHIIDRDGNPVAPFPLEFNDEITRPLAIFDYGKNRKYRFLVVQGNDVYMYNNDGNRVKGFTFSKASSEIIKVPKHIRIGRKDYILIAEASGKLNILSRQGKIRVPVEEKLKFSENEWYENEGHFVSTNKAGELLKIDQTGQLNTLNLGFPAPPALAATENMLVILSGNELLINGKRFSLDFGLYTKPQIFNINNKNFVSLTDLQSSRVFIFNADGNLLPGFPVYGNSIIDMGNTDNDRNPEFVVQGEENSLLLYEIGIR